MRKTVKYVILLIILILFFLSFIPVTKIDTPQNYWDSADYDLISTELDSLLEIYSAYAIRGDSSKIKEVIIYVFGNDYYTSVFGFTRRGRRAQKTITVGYLKEADCVSLFPNNPERIMILKENYKILITYLRDKINQFRSKHRKASKHAKGAMSS
jgi:hypothetical protein